MESENKRLKVLIVILLVFLIAFGGYYFYEKVVVAGNDSGTTDNKKVADEVLNVEDVVDSSSEDEITQEMLEKIIVDELYIITQRTTNRKSTKSISDIENYDLLAVVINKYNNSDSSLPSISQKDMQNILNETCLSNMTITYDGSYAKNEYTKINLFYGRIGAFKTISFNEQDGKYKLSVKYIFIDNYDSGDRGLNGYGKMDDLIVNENPIVQLRDDYNNIQIVSDVQKYLDDNFDSIKDKLSTYNYTFEKQNGKIVLTDLSVD